MKSADSDDRSETHLVGVELVYCRDGRMWRRRLPVTNRDFQGLIWGPAADPANANAPPKPDPLPTGRLFPNQYPASGEWGVCPPISQRSSHHLCYWNGSQWVCPDDPE